jgi:hypothetical protein
VAKKKITVEYIDEATKDELLDIAGRLKIEDRVHYKMLKAEVHDIVLTEFLVQQEPPTPEETTAPPIEEEPVKKPLLDRPIPVRTGPDPFSNEPEEPKEESVVDLQPADVVRELVLSYAIERKRKETPVPDWNLRAVCRQLGIKKDELRVLEQMAVHKGQAEKLVSKFVKGRLLKVLFIVRAS